MGAERVARGVSRRGGGVRLVRSTCTYICKYNHYANGPWFYINIICGLACVFPKDTGTHRETERERGRERREGEGEAATGCVCLWVGTTVWFLCLL